MLFADATQILQSGLVLVSAVWAIATIKSTTEKLGLRIDQLGSVIQDLKDSMRGNTADVENLKERVIRLEINADSKK